MKLRFSKVAALIAFCTLFALPLFANGAAGAAAAVSSTAVAALVAGGVAAAKEIISKGKEDGTQWEANEAEHLIAIGKLVDQVGAGMMSKEEADKAIGELKAENAQIQESLAKAIGALHKQAQKGFNIGTVQNVTKALDTNDLLTKFFEQPENADFKTKVKEGSPFMATVGKAAGSMLLSTNITGALTNVASTEIQPGLTDLRRNQPKLYDLIRKAFTSSSHITYVEKKNPDGAAAMTAEGTVKPLVDFDLASATSRAKKVTAAARVSMEMLNDIPFMSSEIDKELRFAIYKTLSAQIRSGNNTGEQLQGLTTVGSAFAVATIKTTAPTNIDAIFAVVSAGKILTFNYDVIVVNPIDYANMKLAKDTTGQYIMQNGMLDGLIQVVEDNDQTVGSFIAFDSSVVNFYIYEDLQIKMGLNGEDFRENMFTIIAEMRAHMFVKSNEVNGVLDDTFALVKTAITAP